MDLSIETYILLITIVANFGIILGVQQQTNKYTKEKFEEISEKFERMANKLDKHNHFSDRLAILETKCSRYDSYDEIIKDIHESINQLNNRRGGSL